MAPISQDLSIAEWHADEFLRIYHIAESFTEESIAILLENKHFVVSDLHFGPRMDVLHIVYCFIYVALLDRAVIILTCELVALQSASPFEALPCGYLPYGPLPTSRVWSLTV